MGKGKRNKRPRRDEWLDDPLAVANAEVAAAERVLTEKRRRAAAAAATRNGHSAPASPEEQYAEFLNRPGDFYICRFDVGGKINETQGVTYIAECVLKADEAQRDYLVEVLRQIRGAFGEQARISLTRAQQTQQRVADDRPTVSYDGIGRVHAAAREAMRRREPIADGPPYDLARDFYLGERSGSDDPEFRQHVADMLAGDMVPDRELTREELQAQLPGMTRAEVADELGIEPADIGGDIKGADTIELEQLAAELGLSPLDLMPIDVRGGGRVYAVKPRQTQPPAGRHAAPDGDTGDNAAGGAP